MAGQDEPGLHPAHIYAFERCGFIVTEATKHLFDLDDLLAWNRAVEAWFDAHPEHGTPDAPA